jgi:hypothetical protein
VNPKSPSSLPRSSLLQEDAKKASASGLLHIRRSPGAPSSAGAPPVHSAPSLAPALEREGRLAAPVDGAAGAASSWSSAHRRLRRRGAPRGGAKDDRRRERPTKRKTRAGSSAPRARRCPAAPLLEPTAAGSPPPSPATTVQRPTKRETHVDAIALYSRHLDAMT